MHLGKTYKINKSLGNYPDGIEGVLLGCMENDRLWAFRVSPKYKAPMDIIEAWEEDVELLGTGS